MAKSSEDITLLEIYELMEGKVEAKDCLLDRPICRNGECIFGDRLVRMRDEIREHLSNTSLSEVKNLFGVKK